MFKKRELAVAVALALSVSHGAIAENSDVVEKSEDIKNSRSSAAGSISGLSMPTAIAVGIVGAAILGGSSGDSMSPPPAPAPTPTPTPTPVSYTHLRAHET